MIVVDASLAAKWLLDEDQSDQARRFLMQFLPEICAPELLLTEVASAVVTATNMAPIATVRSRGASAKWFDFWYSETIRTRRQDVAIMKEATEIALALSHPLPDCVYLALALDLDCALATCDAKFHSKAFPKFGRVKMLTSFAAV